MQTDDNQVVTVEDYELSHSYLGNKPQHRGCDEYDRYSGEYRVAILTMSDGSTQYGLWCDGYLYDDYFPTEEEATDALRAEWKNDKGEHEAQHADDDGDDEPDNDDNEEENEEPSLRHIACFADTQNEGMRQERMLEASV
jgi:hypothetical protein